MFIKNRNSAFVALLFLLLTLIACTPDLVEGEPIAEEPTPEPTEVSPAADHFDLSGVSIDDLAVNVAGPVLSVTVSGNILSGCHTFKEVVSRQTETGWDIGVDNSLMGQVCTDAKVLFEGIIVLAEEALPTGSYHIQAGLKVVTITVAENGELQIIDSSDLFDPGKEIVITLERTPCFGFCPTYTLEIHRDGTVIYNGIANVAVMGEQTGQLSEENIQSLLLAFKDLGYFELADEYNEYYVSDMPSTITSITLDRLQKQIVRYGGDANAPVALQELEILIDELANSEQWTGSPAPELMVVGEPPPFVEGEE